MRFWVRDIANPSWPGLTHGCPVQIREGSWVFFIVMAALEAAMTGFDDRPVLNLRTGQLWAWPGQTKSARCRERWPARSPAMTEYVFALRGEAARRACYRS